MCLLHRFRGLFPALFRATMENNTRVRGLKHEQAAADYLFSQEGSLKKRLLICRSFQKRTGEIDLILEEERIGESGGIVELVFVEVRARCSTQPWVDGIASVDWKKRMRIEKTARIFLVDYRGLAKRIRFDIMSWNGMDWIHLEDAWRP